MTGKELKARLDTLDIQYQVLASQMGMSQPNFSASLKVADVKTGLLEKLCEVLGVDMSFFYPQMGTINNVNNNIHNQQNGNGNTITDNSSDTNKDELINKLVQQNSDLMKLVMENRK